MLTHKIEFTAPPAPPAQSTNMRTHHEFYGHNRPTVIHTQEDLDRYIATKDWIKPGVLCKYVNVSPPYNEYSVFMVIAVDHDFESCKMRGDYYGYKKCFFITNFHFRGDEPIYKRWEGGHDLVPLTPQEITITKERMDLDNLQDRVKQWAVKNGFTGTLDA